MNNQAVKFRSAFVQKGLQQKLTSWFPGHMDKGMKQMQRKLGSVDCIIEVHDARVPFSGRNPNFYTKLTAIRPHIMVLNKMDLADLTRLQDIEEKLLGGIITNVIFTNSKDSLKGNVNQILPLAIELMQNADNFRLAFQADYNLMVIGIPNVGKSSLINRLRNIHMNKKSANPTGAKPGVTKSVLEKVKISVDPPVYLYDTPGVIQPNIRNVEVGLRLALCSTLNDHVVGEELMADYLLYWLNKHRNFSYVPYFGIPEPLDNIRLLLMQVATLLNRSLKIRNAEGSFIDVPDMKYAALHFLKAFREGAFGKVLLDDDELLNKT